MVMSPAQAASGPQASGQIKTLAVALGQDVEKDQVIATVADPFGRVVETIRAPVAGKINVIATDPTREPGDTVVRIVWWSKDPKCKDGC